MSGSTTNYAWTIPTLGENPYYADMLSFFTSVDLEMMHKSKGFDMGGNNSTPNIIAGGQNASGNLTITSTTSATKGRVNFGNGLSNVVWVDEANGGVVLPHVSAYNGTANGTLYTTTSGLYAIINGSVVGPMQQVGNAAPQGPYSVVAKSANYSLLSTDLNKQLVLSGNNNIVITVPSANANIAGYWEEIQSYAAGSITLTLASGTWWNAANLTSVVMGQRTKIWTDGTYWYGSPLEVAISEVSVVSGGTNSSGHTALTLSSYVPVAAKYIFGSIYGNGVGRSYISPTANTIGQISQSGPGWSFYRLTLQIPQTIYYIVDSGGGIGLELAGYGF